PTGRPSRQGRQAVAGSRHADRVVELLAELERRLVAEPRVLEERTGCRVDDPGLAGALAVGDADDPAGARRLRLLARLGAGREQRLESLAEPGAGGLLVVLRPREVG